MGAAGAVLGTRFKASVEYDGAPELKSALVASDGGDTLHDEIFDDACGLDWPCGVTGRALRNRFSTQWEGRRDALRAEVAARPPFGFLAELMRDPALTINWAGESAGLVDEVQPASAIVRALVDEAEARLRAAARVLA